MVSMERSNVRCVQGLSGSLDIGEGKHRGLSTLCKFNIIFFYIKLS